MTGAFIVLEALDGVGKSTLAQALAERLGGVAMDTPGPRLRALSPEILGALGAEPTARALFYAASVIAEGRRARQLADEGRVVVMDRYWLSTVSYALARGADAGLRDLEALVPVPDLTILLTLDEDERQARLHRRGCTEADRETLRAAFRESVLAEMLRPRGSALVAVGAVIDLAGLDVESSISRVESAVRDGLAGRFRTGAGPRVLHA